MFGPREDEISFPFPRTHHCLLSLRLTITIVSSTQTACSPNAHVHQRSQPRRGIDWEPENGGEESHSRCADGEGGSESPSTNNKNTSEESRLTDAPAAVSGHINVSPQQQSSALPPRRSLQSNSSDARDAGAGKREPACAPLTLLTLPEDAVVLILNVLDTKSLCSLCVTCRQLRAVAGSDMLWRNLFQARWRWRPPTWALAAVLPWSSPLAQTIEGPPQGGWQTAFAERFTQQNRPPQLSPSPSPPPEPSTEPTAFGAEGREEHADEDHDDRNGNGDDTHAPSQAGRRRLPWSQTRTHRHSHASSATAGTSAAAAAGVGEDDTAGRRREPRTVLVNREGRDAPASVVQAALDACLPGDVLLLTPATYAGSVTLPPGVELRGNGPRGAVLIVSDEEPAVSFGTW